jgi:hypothetical protein
VIYDSSDPRDDTERARRFGHLLEHHTPGRKRRTTGSEPGKRNWIQISNSTIADATRRLR